MTAFDETVVIISTSSDDATTRNAMTNAAMALRFFLVYFFPSISSIPSTFVFSNIAKTIVNTSRKGRTTSNSPIVSKKFMTPLKGVTPVAVAIGFHVQYRYLNVLFLIVSSKKLVSSLKSKSYSEYNPADKGESPIRGMSALTYDVKDFEAANLSECELLDEAAFGKSAENLYKQYIKCKHHVKQG